MKLPRCKSKCQTFLLKNKVKNNRDVLFIHFKYITREIFALARAWISVLMSVMYSLSWLAED